MRLKATLPLQVAITGVPHAARHTSSFLERGAHDGSHSAQRRQGGRADPKPGCTSQPTHSSAALAAIGGLRLGNPAELFHIGKMGSACGSILVTIGRKGPVGRPFKVIS